MVAVTTSNNAASPVNLENPSPATAGDATSAPSQSPAATSLTRSTAGETGVGQSPNFDRGMPAPRDKRASGLGRGAARSSTIDSGAAPAASSPSSIRRSQAQAQIDSATAVAQDAAPADYRAGAVPTQLDATSGAAVARSASAAPRGSIAAEAGNLPADTGASRIVSRTGLRAAMAAANRTLRPSPTPVSPAARQPRATRSPRLPATWSHHPRRRRASGVPPRGSAPTGRTVRRGAARRRARECKPAQRHRRWRNCKYPSDGGGIRRLRLEANLAPPRPRPARRPARHAARRRHSSPMPGTKRSSRQRSRNRRASPPGHASTPRL